MPQVIHQEGAPDRHVGRCPRPYNRQVPQTVLQAGAPDRPAGRCPRLSNKAGAPGRPAGRCPRSSIRQVPQAVQQAGAPDRPAGRCPRLSNKAGAPGRPSPRVRAAVDDGAVAALELLEMRAAGRRCRAAVGPLSRRRGSCGPGRGGGGGGGVPHHATVASTSRLTTATLPHDRPTSALSPVLLCSLAVLDQWSKEALMPQISLIRPDVSIEHRLARDRHRQTEGHSC